MQGVKKGNRIKNQKLRINIQDNSPNNNDITIKISAPIANANETIIINFSGDYSLSKDIIQTCIEIAK